MGEEQAVLDVSKASRERPLMRKKREIRANQQLAATASSGSQLGLQVWLHVDCQFRCRCRCGGTGCEWLRIRLKVDVRLELEKVGGEACVECRPLIHSGTAGAGGLASRQASGLAVGARSGLAVGAPRQPAHHRCR